MMKPLSKFIILFNLIGILLFAGCELNADGNDFEADLEELIAMQTAIEELADTSVCTEETECLFIAFGSKPCGGPWSYLIYSSSIDTAQLEEMVEAFNIKQDAFNATYNQVSDCMAVLPPSSLICENGECMSGS